MESEQLLSILLKSWSEHTATNGIWSEKNPSLNQCAVTALVVQDFLGGDLLRCEMSDGDSHYWNRLPDGTELDLTSEQFKKIDAHPLLETTEIRTRQYVLSFPKTMLRYGILLKRVSEEILKGKNNASYYSS